MQTNHLEVRVNMTTCDVAVLYPGIPAQARIHSHTLVFVCNELGNATRYRPRCHQSSCFAYACAMMQQLASKRMIGGGNIASFKHPHRSLVLRPAQTSCRRLLRTGAISPHSPQPIADIARGLPGAGRLASKAAEALSNPKDHKHKQQKQSQQDEENANQQQQQTALEQQQQEQVAQEAETAAVENIESAAAGLAAAEHTGVPEAADLAPEAVAVVVPVQQQEISDYTEEEIQSKTIQDRYHDTTRFLTSSTVGRGISIAAGLFLGATFLIALYKTYQKYTSPRAQRKRVIDKNKQLVEELSKYLPTNRSGLTPAVARKLRSLTGFTPVEVFRKYLWFMLRERKFDVAAVEDMVLLKTVLGLTDDQVAEALQERAQRIYDKYGTLMLNTEGMTAEGLERKATCRALFSKLLYLTEHEPLVAPGSEAFKTTDLRMIFGATDEDTDKLRIVSLYDIDIDNLDALVQGKAGDEGSSDEEQGDAANEANRKQGL